MQRLERQAPGRWSVIWRRSRRAAAASFLFNVVGGSAFLIGAARLTMTADKPIGRILAAAFALVLIWRVGGGLLDLLLPVRWIDGPLRELRREQLRRGQGDYFVASVGKHTWNLEWEAVRRLEKGDPVAVAKTPILGSVVAVARRT